MNRRDALLLTTKVIGGTIIGSELFLSGCRNEPAAEGKFGAAEIAFLDEIGETILPHTDRSPGAREARIGQFMETIVTDCYEEDERRQFIKGIPDIDRRARDVFAAGFMKLSPEQRHTLLSGLDREARDESGKGNIHYFTMMKQLTVWGYFTSEPGATQALRYNPIPGKFIGCIPYREGDKAWA